jgi:ABC-type Fe3+-hydroxamate transport system substrate-binding protein
MTTTLCDDLGRSVELEPPPTRIVSLVPSLTELVFALGCGSRLVGVTRYCVEPAAKVAPITKVGGTKTPDLEAILRLAPDLVMANAEENRREDVETLCNSGVRVFVTYPRTVAQVARMIRALGMLLEAREPAERLAGRIAAARNFGNRSSSRVRVFCPIWKNPWMTFSGDTYASDLLAHCGGENVCAALSPRYPEVELDAVARMDPQVILLPDEPFRFERKHLANLKPLANTSAAKTGRIYFVDGKALTWFGPRTPRALEYFTRLLA